MRRMLVTFAIAAAFLAALLLTPSQAAADSLTGSVTFTWLYPNGTPFQPSQSIAVGSSLLCPNASISWWSYYSPGNTSWTIGPNFLSYSSTHASTFTPAAFNGFDFSGLTFLNGGTITGFTLTTNIPGLTAADVTFGPSDIRVNLQGLSTFGTFTITPIVSTPEPGMLALLAAGLAGLLFLRARHAA